MDKLTWDFEIKGDPSGTDRMLASLDRLDKTLGSLDKKLDATEKATLRAGDGHRKHAREAEGLAGAARRLIQSGLDPLESKFKQIAEFEFIREGVEKLLELPGKIARGVVDLGEAMIGTAAKTERLENSFRLLFGTAEGNANLDYVNKVYKQTEFTDDQIKAAMLELGRVGFKGEGLDRALAAAHDMAAFSANPEEGFSGALASLSRIERTGRIDNRVLGGLGIGEHDFFGELAKRTGRSADALKKAMDEGTIKADDALETLYSMIAKKTGKSLGGAGVEMSKSMTALLTHVKDLPDQYFQNLADSPALGAFKDQLSRVLDELDPDSPNGKRIFGALEDSFAFVADVVSKIDIASVVEAGTDALEGFEATLAAAISLLPGEAGKKGDALLDGVAHRKLDREHERRTGDKAAAALMASPTYGRDLDELDAASLSGELGPTSKRYAEMAGEDMGAAAEAGIRKKTRTHSPSDAFRDVGVDLAAGLALGFNAGLDTVAPPTTTIAHLGAAGAGRAPVTITMNNTVNVDGAGRDAPAIAEEVSRRLPEILPGALTSAFEQIRMEAG